MCIYIYIYIHTSSPNNCLIYHHVGTYHRARNPQTKLQMAIRAHVAVDVHIAIARMHSCETCHGHTFVEECALQQMSEWIHGSRHWSFEHVGRYSGVETGHGSGIESLTLAFRSLESKPATDGHGAFRRGLSSGSLPPESVARWARRCPPRARIRLDFYVEPILP